MATALATHLVYHYASAKPTIQNHTGKLSPSQLKRVVEHIEAYIDQDLSLAELARLNHLNSFHFARLFKQSTGIPPHQYHIYCRIKRTKQLLLQKELTLAEIAQAVGFASQSHFNYHFKRIVGLTPTAFLRQ